MTCLYCIDMIEVKELYDFDNFKIRDDLVEMRL